MVPIGSSQFTGGFLIKTKRKVYQEPRFLVRGKLVKVFEVMSYVISCDEKNCFVKYKLSGLQMESEVIRCQVKIKY